MKSAGTARLWAFGIMAFLAIMVGIYALAMYVMPSHIQEAPLVKGKGELPTLWYPVLWAHAISSGLAIAIGWLQFIKRLRVQKPNLHRAIGYVYACLIAIGGITGLYLSWYADGGWLAATGFGVLSTLWMYTLYQGIVRIVVARDLAGHGRWMIRNYALTCAAITLRLYMPLAAILFGLSDPNDTFAVIAWLCWVPNLLVAESLVARRPSVGSRKSYIQ